MTHCRDVHSIYTYLSFLCRGWRRRQKLSTNDAATGALHFHRSALNHSVLWRHGCLASRSPDVALEATALPYSLPCCAKADLYKCLSHATAPLLTKIYGGEVLQPFLVRIIPPMSSTAQPLLKRTAFCSYGALLHSVSVCGAAKNLMKGKGHLGLPFVAILNSLFWVAWCRS